MLDDKSKGERKKGKTGSTGPAPDLAQKSHNRRFNSRAKCLLLLSRLAAFDNAAPDEKVGQGIGANHTERDVRTFASSIPL